MYQLIKRLSLQEIMTEVIPSLVGSLIIAETFYKFGSFTIECIFFLLTFLCLLFFIGKIKNILSQQNKKS